MQTEKKMTAKQRYNAKTAVHYRIKLNKNTDMELINKLKSVPNKQDYIKSCIKKMMELEQEILV